MKPFAQSASARAIDLMAASSFVWLEPELRRIEALILKETEVSNVAEEALRRAIECAERQGSPILQRRCLVTLRDLLGQSHRDFELEAKLKKLSYLGDLAQKVAAAMKNSPYRLHA